MASDPTRREIERVARESYARLLAFLAVRTREMVAAEDALGDAVQAALASWPETGVPANPEAWLLTSARRRLIDAARHVRVRSAAEDDLRTAAEHAQGSIQDAHGFPDERLAMLFACAHPAIDEQVRTPLELQAVLGVDAARIAAAFLVRPAAMGQRLTRAKTKIRDAGIAFTVPDPEQLPDRLATVLDAVYAAYGAGAMAHGIEEGPGMRAEAIDLARLIANQMPDQGEALGLLALLLHVEARRPAARSALGAYVPLSQQDPARWNRVMQVEGETVLHHAGSLGVPGRYQFEAAIHSAHAQRAVTGCVDTEAIALLYEGLVRCAPSIGALVGRAAAVADARDAATGWNLLSGLHQEDVATYQPYWAVAADLLRRLGRRQEAAAAYARAIDLSSDDAVRAFLARQAAAVAE